MCAGGPCAAAPHPRNHWETRSARLPCRAAPNTPTTSTVAAGRKFPTRPTAGVGVRGRESQDQRDEGRERPMAGQKIRIRLKAYDHEVIDTSARKIVDTVTRTGARVAGPVPLPTEKNVYCVI